MSRNDSKNKQENQMLDKRVEQLHQHLVSRYRRPNVITWDEFVPFLPLFQDVQFETEEEKDEYVESLSSLGAQYIHKFTRFKNIIIVDSKESNNVILEIPKLMMELNADPATSEESLKNDAIKNRLGSDKPSVVMSAYGQIISNVGARQKTQEMLKKFIDSKIDAKRIHAEFKNRKSGKDVTSTVRQTEATEEYHNNLIFDEDDE